jgi:5,10-methylenetetrahydrofolate reductase
MPNLVEALRSGKAVIAAELRPPRAELAAAEGMDAWIDTYHAVRRLTRQGTFVFLTDSAVGADEEDNLRHLVTNLGADVPRGRVVPFLTCKHPFEYCLAYAERARQHRFPSLVVLGGDRHVGHPRCVEHAFELRRAIRETNPELLLGGWANPYADAAEQVRHLVARDFHGEFFLTQIVTHHAAAPIARFLAEAQRQELSVPGVFGVFFYRSANRRTLDMLSGFLSVPAAAIAREFADGASAEEICARTIRTMRDLGARHFYVSNLPLGRAHQTLERIVDLARSG